MTNRTKFKQPNNKHMDISEARIRIAEYIRDEVTTGTRKPNYFTPDEFMAWLGLSYKEVTSVLYGLADDGVIKHMNCRGMDNGRIVQFYRYNMSPEELNQYVESVRTPKN